MGPKRVIGVDLGGTKILAARLDPDGTIEERYEVPTPTASQDELLEGIAQAIEGVAGSPVRSPRLRDPIGDRSRDRSGAGLDQRPAGRRLAPGGHGRALRVPAVVENDANVAALAEWRLGAGRSARTLVMLTLGTGVGGGLILDGALFRGWAEFGHVVVVADGPPCQGTCTGRGHLEAVASGNAADRAAERLWGEGATAELLVGRAHEGDPEALEALNGIGHLLGAGIGSLVNIFFPELVVVGGGFGKAAGEFLFPEALEVARREALEPAGAGLRIVPAELGSDAGVVGAGLLAFDELEQES